MVGTRVIPVLMDLMHDSNPGVRSRAMERSLRAVQQLPADKASALLNFSESVSLVEPEAIDGEENP